MVDTTEERKFSRGRWVVLEGAGAPEDETPAADRDRRISGLFFFVDCRMIGLGTTGGIRTLGGGVIMVVVAGGQGEKEGSNVEDVAVVALLVVVVLVVVGGVGADWTAIRVPFELRNK
jgi:hypothetical protein